MMYPIHSAPCIYESDGGNGMDIYLENEENRQAYLQIKANDKVVLQGNCAHSYVYSIFVFPLTCPTRSDTSNNNSNSLCLKRVPHGGNYGF